MNHFKPISSVTRSVLVYGGEGTGKTSFALTAPGPRYLVGTEGGREQIRMQGIEDAFYAGINPPSDRKLSQVWFSAYSGMWNQLEEIAGGVLGTLDPGTVIIDSASDLLGIASAGLDTELRRGQKPIPPLMYGQLYGMLKDLLTVIRERHNLILTARVKDVYSGDEKTGETTMDVWGKAVYLVDDIIEIVREPRTGLRFAWGTKGNPDGCVIANPTWERVVEGDIFPGYDDRAYYLTIQRIVKALAYFEAKEIPCPFRVPKTREDAEEYLKELRALLAPANGQEVADN